MATKKRVPEKGIIMMCGTQGCCPTIDFTDPTKVVLKDDFGGLVQLSPAEWQDLKDKFMVPPQSV